MTIKMLSRPMAFLLRISRAIRGRYRPERHYMRGPGPAAIGKKQSEQGNPGGQETPSNHGST